jgi:hypothetical protein
VREQAGLAGYCLHSTLAARPDTRESLAALRRIGENCGPAVPPGVDFTHFDFQFMNLLDDGRVTICASPGWSSATSGRDHDMPG